MKKHIAQDRTSIRERQRYARNETKLKICKVAASAMAKHTEKKKFGFMFHSKCTFP